MAGREEWVSEARDASKTARTRQVTDASPRVTDHHTSHRGASTKSERLSSLLSTTIISGRSSSMQETYTNGAGLLFFFS